MKRVYLILFFPLCCFSATISYAQNVGIGTTTPDPAAKLEVQSTTSGILIPRLTTIQKTAIPSPPAGLMVFDNSVNQFSFYDGIKWINLKTSVINDSIWDSYVSSSERIIFNAIGQHIYLGGSPIQPISTGGGGGNIDGVLRLEHGSPLPLLFSYFLAMDGNNIQARTRSGGVFSPPVEGNLLLNRYGGNVGLGTGTPVRAKLEVNGFVGNTVGLFSRTSNSQGISLVSDWPGVYFNCYYNGGVKSMANSGYAGIINTDQNTGDFTFAIAPSASTGSDLPVSLSEIMRITKEGRVGIGTSNPTYPLSVNGQIQAKEIRVETGWSDYVFDKEYKLRSLNEVENYIHQHHHLPDLPYASEIREHGLPVAEINTKMMAKIEELTLYVIELEKQIRRQERQLAKMKASKTGIKLQASQQK